MSHWRTKSRKVILDALKEADAAGLRDKAREKFVSDRYPFGERAMTPYKIWRHEFNLLVRGINKPMEKPRAKAGPKLLGTWPGYGDLFAEEEKP